MSRWLGSRRLFVVSTVAIVALVVAACGTAELTPTAQPTPTLAPSPGITPTPTLAPSPGITPTPTPGPRYGGTLNVAFPQQPFSFSPLKSTFDPIQTIMSPIYSHIVEPEPADNSMIRPDLADSWRITDAGQSYIFTLRNNIVWQDGRPLTAVDVKGSLDAIKLANTDSILRNLLGDIDSVEVVEPLTLAIRLQRPSASLLNRLAFYLVIPRHVIDTGGDLETNFVGTGPFKFKNLSKDNSFEVTRNEGYFIKGQPYLDGIRSLFIAEESLRIAAIQTGRVDMLDKSVSIGLAAAELLKRGVPRILTDSFETGGTLGFLLQTERPPWNDIRARRALHLAFDRQRAIEVAGQGAGSLSILPVFGAFAIPRDELITLPGFRQPKEADVAEAKRLMQLVNPPHDRTIILQIPNVPQKAIQDALGAIGVELLRGFGLNAQIRELAVAQVSSDQRSGNYDIQVVSAKNQVPTEPDGMSGSLLGEVGSSLRWKPPPGAAELFREQAIEVDANKRKQLLKELQLLWLEELPLVSAFSGVVFVARWDFVRNFFPGIGSRANTKHSEVWLAR